MVLRPQVVEEELEQEVGCPGSGERQGWRGGKDHDGHTGMIYSREGMRHQCWSLVIVSTERGRQVGVG